jgi:hypothetical protein
VPEAEDTAVDERDELDRELREEEEREAADRRRRQREVYGGGIQWEAAFFGWLSAIGLAAMLVAMVIGAGIAVGLTEIDQPASEQTETLNIGGGALLVAILALAYLSGGYVAGRMARFDGWRQGLGVWLLALLATLGLAAAGALGGSEYNVLERLSLPRIPVDEPALSTGGAIALGAIVLGTLAAAIAGGIFGERYHRQVDLAGGASLDEEEETVRWRWPRR